MLGRTMARSREFKALVMNSANFWKSIEVVYDSGRCLSRDHLN